ncbi:MAG TPA: cytochrome P450 [Thermomicrobiales bacterium]|nr:cytochrome P450 [Thermomicrobiales bacterium]
MVIAEDLWTHEHVADPYPVYRRLLAEAPVTERNGSWILSGYEHVLTALTDRRMSSVRGTLQYLPEEERAKVAALIETNRDMILFLDAPDHTRLRGLVAQAFSAKMIESMRLRIHALVDTLLDEVDGQSSWDVMTALAQPLPGMVITMMLGTPLEDWTKVRAWSEDYADWLGSVVENEQQRMRANQAVIEWNAYIREQAAQRRQEPRDDLLTALVMAEDDGDRLTEQEVLSTCLLLLFAGNETTTNLIGNGLLTLLRQPDAWRQLRDDPSLIRTATEEFLRYESPVQFTGRFTTAEMEFGSHTVPAWSHITTLIGAANRDPRHFAEPDALDLARRPNRHISFAHGAHFCLGAPLARAEGQLAINAVVQRFPTLALESPERADWIYNPVFRAQKTLRVVT